MTLPIPLKSSDPSYVKVVEDFYATQLEALRVFANKHAQYGPANVAAIGFSGVLSRVKNDKLERLAHSDSTTPGDSILDNCLDTSNYGVILAMLYRGQWPMPSPETQIENLLNQAQLAIASLKGYCDDMGLSIQLDAALLELQKELSK